MTSPTGFVELRVGLLPIISSLKLEGRDKGFILEEFPRVKSSWQVPKQVMETRTWSDNRSQEMEPKQSGFNVGQRQRVPWKRRWKKGSDRGWGKMAGSLHLGLALSQRRFTAALFVRKQCGKHPSTGMNKLIGGVGFKSSWKINKPEQHGSTQEMKNNNKKLPLKGMHSDNHFFLSLFFHNLFAETSVDVSFS